MMHEIYLFADDLFTHSSGSYGYSHIEWAVPHQSKLKYTQLFNTTDRARSGFLSGHQARNIMVSTGVPEAVLAQIWYGTSMYPNVTLGFAEFLFFRSSWSLFVFVLLFYRGLADMDSDGRLSCDEFVLALHLCDMARAGEKIPATLPADLIPPAFRRQRQGSVPGSGAVVTPGSDKGIDLESASALINQGYCLVRVTAFFSAAWPLIAVLNTDLLVYFT
jgi:hypothetical protein